MRRLSHHTKRCGRTFLEWLPKAPSVDGPPSVVFNAYRDLLIKTGVSIQEADQRLDVIRRMHRERPDAWRVMFNNIYTSEKPGFATEPNALLISTVEGRKPGRALDIGMGQGRNSVFLALKGWDVTGFDLSDEGIATARRNADRAGVKINAIRRNRRCFRLRHRTMGSDCIRVRAIPDHDSRLCGAPAPVIAAGRAYRH